MGPVLIEKCSISQSLGGIKSKLYIVITTEIYNDFHICEILNVEYDCISLLFIPSANSNFLRNALMVFDEMKVAQGVSKK